MAQKKAGKMRFVLSALALCMVAQQSLYNNVEAGMITGIAPEIGADGNKIYNIDPSVINGDIGFRLYEEFQLNKGEIANLIFILSSPHRKASPLRLSLLFLRSHYQFLFLGLPYTSANPRQGNRRHS